MTVPNDIPVRTVLVTQTFFALERRRKRERRCPAGWLEGEALMG